MLASREEDCAHIELTTSAILVNPEPGCLSVKVTSRMNEMNEWKVDINKRTVQHTSGLTIQFEGEPETDHFAGSFKHYPRDLTPLQIARLIREGFDEFRSAWKETCDVRPVLRLKSR